MTTVTKVANEGSGTNLIIVKVMYQAAKDKSYSGPNKQDYAVEEQYLVPGQSREFNVTSYQYLLVEEVHP